MESVVSASSLKLFSKVISKKIVYKIMQHHEVFQITTNQPSGTSLLLLQGYLELTTSTYLSSDLSDSVRESDRDRERDRETETETKTETETDTERQRDRETERQRDRERGKVRNFQELFLKNIYILTFSLLNL